MKRTVLMNGQEVDISEVISKAPVKRNIFGDTPATEPFASEEKDEEEKLEKLILILEIRIRENMHTRQFGAGGYRFYG